MGVASEDRAPVTIDADVELLTDQIQALEALGRKNPIDDGKVYDVSVRWGAAMAGRLPRLLHYNSLGLLDDADRRRFESLCAELRRVSDLAERLGLPRPALSDDRAATAKERRRLRMRSRHAKRRS